MRLFYEAWQPLFTKFSNRQLPNDEIQILTKSENILDLGLLLRHMNNFIIAGFSADAFFNIGFSHHSEILAKEKLLDGRLFYISHCAAEFLTVDALKSYLRGDLYAKTGAMLTT